MSESLLKGKVAVVTGGGRGIGKAIAIAAAKAGAKVVVNAVNQKAGHGGNTVNEIILMGGQAVVGYGDVSDFEQSKELIQTALSNFGRIDILVNNAGISGGKRMPWEMSEEEWDRMISIHLKGTFNCTRQVCSLMKEQRWGRIINCTSGSWISRSGGCHYAAAKAGIVGFTRAVAMDMVEYGVTCNAYHPFAKTDMLGDQMASLVEKRFKLGKIDREEYEWQLKPPGPEGVGPFVVYLASEEAAGINGKIFYVSGGKIAVYSEPERKKTIFKKEGIWTVEELREQGPKLLL
jgi:NAD(P)-dependent dehydrogenase (short-subunit alcohol dehydrogenase family)